MRRLFRSRLHNCTTRDNYNKSTRDNCTRPPLYERTDSKCTIARGRGGWVVKILPIDRDAAGTDAEASDACEPAAAPRHGHAPHATRGEQRDAAAATGWPGPAHAGKNCRPGDFTRAVGRQRAPDGRHRRRGPAERVHDGDKAARSHCCGHLRDGAPLCSDLSRSLQLAGLSGLEGQQTYPSMARDMRRSS